MSAQAKALRAKGWWALVAAAAIVIFVAPVVLSVYQQAWRDRGTRPLIILATESVGQPYSMQVRTEVDAAGELTFRFYLKTDVAPEGGAAPEARRVDVIAVGRGLEGTLRCGAGFSAASSIAATDLDRGPRRAYEVDRNSTIASATTKEVVAGELDFVRMGGTMSPLVPDQAEPGPSLVGADGSVAVQQCSLASSVVWSARTAGSPTEAVRATLFAPQFNLTTFDGETDLISRLEAHLWVARADGATLIEAYPEPDSDYAGWGLWFTSTPYDDPAGADFHYTDQPTWMFGNRNAARFEQAMLLFGGMLLGLALSLMHGGISDLIDARVTAKHANA